MKSCEKLNNNDMTAEDMERYPETESLPAEARAYLQKFYVSDETFKTVLTRFENAIYKSLAQEDFLSTPLKMLPTYVTRTPTGHEAGRYFAVDFGGTNMRFLSLDVNRKVIQTESKSFKIPASIMTGTCDQLFRYIANCLEEGLIAANAIDQDIGVIGMTFSFPLKQTSLNSGNLVKWCKGFEVEGVVGQDVGYLLMNAFHNKKLRVGKLALINDTTGTLMSAAFFDPDVKIGIIVGTGTNACYIEKISNIRSYGNVRLYPDTVIVNTEWGSFGEKQELDDILTDVDRLVDQRSIHPGDHIFEKLISGMYVGEIAREIMIEFVKRKFLFDGVMPEKLNQVDIFTGQLLSDAYYDDKLKVYIKETLGIEISPMDITMIFNICAIISLRAARLAAAGLIVLMNRINTKRISIAADGSMIKLHPMFMKYIKDAIEGYDSHKIFKMVTSEDGSGIGAALVAATQYAVADTGTYCEDFQYFYE